MALLPRRTPPEVLPLKRAAVPASILTQARIMLAAIEQDGEAALRTYAERFDGLAAGAALRIERPQLDEAARQLDPTTRELLQGAAARIRHFAEAQRECLRGLDMVIPGGRAGHSIAPIESVGCYAPGGRYPLPSSVLMTVIPARVAGVSRVVVASPRPGRLTLAAAAIAGADALVPVGGVQAVAALAFGVGGLAPVDMVVGPGSAWVTAAKQLLVGRIGIDMLAGPSELVVIADAAADASRIAADLLAQAEHDPLALPVLLSCSETLLHAVEAELQLQLEALPTATVARQALANGCAVLCHDDTELAALSDRLAPEHLQLLVAKPQAMQARLRHYGALFVGADAAEVLGDYAAGPNHVLPTGGGARFGGGLSVLTFLRVRTWLQIHDATAAAPITRAAVELARLEGLEGHARAAAKRLPTG